MCNNNNEIKAKEFFIFSYFNIVPKGLFVNKKENDDEKFKNFESYEKYVAYQCAYRAYLDVCRTIKYSVTTTEIEQDKKKYNGYIDLKKAFIDYEINLVLSNFNDLLSASDFDNKHNEICNWMLLDNDNINIDTFLQNITEEDKKEKIKTAFDNYKLFKDKNSFKYGMAQKLLNMTLKNLLLVEDMFTGCTGYGDILKGNRKHFHVPVDKNILKAAKNDLKIKKINNNTYSIEGWSNWIEPTYTEFIKLLREKTQNTALLDWEHTAWMEFAE